MNEQITVGDAKLLKEILKYWDHLSNIQPGSGWATDHCHNEFVAGEELADKLERIATNSLTVAE